MISLLLRTLENMSDEAMVDYVVRCKLDPAAPRPSIETLLHAFVPAASTHLWAEIRDERARTHGTTPDQIEAYYRQRSLLHLEVRPEDVAEAILFLASNCSSRTTCCMLPVDAGVREAFVR
ncbi:MAG: SDR family oxidoreductase [Gemmatimonadota bacterium]